jgi:hypothetical protein
VCSGDQVQKKKKKKKKREHTAARQLPHSLRHQTSENKRIRYQKLRRRKEEMYSISFTQRKRCTQSHSLTLSHVRSGDQVQKKKKKKKKREPHSATRE